MTVIRVQVEVPVLNSLENTVAPVLTVMRGFDVILISMTASQLPVSMDNVMMESMHTHACAILDTKVKIVI